MRIKPAAEPRLAAEGSAGLADAPMADEAASTGDSRLTYSVDEVAEMLGLSRSAVCECIARGEIPAKRVGRRLVVVRTVLEAFLPEPVLRGDRRCAAFVVLRDRSAGRFVAGSLKWRTFDGAL